MFQNHLDIGAFLTELHISQVTFPPESVECTKTLDSQEPVAHAKLQLVPLCQRVRLAEDDAQHDRRIDVGNHRLNEIPVRSRRRSSINASTGSRFKFAGGGLSSRLRNGYRTPFCSSCSGGCIIAIVRPSSVTLSVSPSRTSARCSFRFAASSSTVMVLLIRSASLGHPSLSTLLRCVACRRVWLV